jgi:hypothetical protein
VAPHHRALRLRYRQGETGARSGRLGHQGRSRAPFAGAVPGRRGGSGRRRHRRHPLDGARGP